MELVGQVLVGLHPPHLGGRLAVVREGGVDDVQVGVTGVEWHLK